MPLWLAMCCHTVQHCVHNIATTHGQQSCSIAFAMCRHAGIECSAAHIWSIASDTGWASLLLLLLLLLFAAGCV
jgi:hypothetical protein